MAGLVPWVVQGIVVFQFGGLAEEVCRRLGVQMTRITSRQRASSSKSNGDGDGLLDLAYESERHRQIGGVWSASGPGPRCIVARMAIEPMRVYQEKHSALRSKQAGDKRDINQVIKLDGVALKDAMPFYKIVSGDLEVEAFGRLECLLCDERMWRDLVPIAAKTIELNSLAFRLIMSSGSLLQHNIHSRRHRQPMQTFQRDVGAVDNGVIPPCRHTK